MTAAFALGLVDVAGGNDLVTTVDRGPFSAERLRAASLAASARPAVAAAADERDAEEGEASLDAPRGGLALGAAVVLVAAALRLFFGGDAAEDIASDLDDDDEDEDEEDEDDAGATVDPFSTTS